MSTSVSENATKTVLELDLASYSDIARALEENLDVYAVKAFEDQVQSFVNHGLSAVGLARDDVVLGCAGDNAILVFDEVAVMHRFADAVQQVVSSHNARKSVESAKRLFRMGAATGPVLLLQAERRMVGSTIARAVRLEAAAKTGQILVDAATYELLPDNLKRLYGPEEEICGKRDERFAARRCTFVPGDSRPEARPAKPMRLQATIIVACLLCAITVVFVLLNQGAGGKNKGVVNPIGHLPDGQQANPNSVPQRIPGRDRDAASWAVGTGAEVTISLRSEERTVTEIANLPEEPYRVTHVDFRNADNITDADLARLTGTSVIDLNLEGMPITDAGLEALNGLPLLYLNLSKVGGITDSGAKRISGMRGLKWLYLDDTKVSDEGLAHLMNLPQLEEITLNGTLVTPAGVERLKAALRERGQRCIIEGN